MDAKETNLLSEWQARCRSLERKLESLNEVLGPFVLHGKALKALERNDIATTVSREGSSYLCIGAFKNLMEEVDPEEFGLEPR